MGILEGLEYGGNKINGLRRRKSTLLFDALTERAIGQVGHGVIGHTLIFTVLVHGENIGMIELRDDPSLTLKTAQKRSVVPISWLENLERDLALQALIERQKNFRHAAFADGLDNSVVPDNVIDCVLRLHSTPRSFSIMHINCNIRSEERRVAKECRS